MSKQDYTKPSHRNEPAVNLIRSKIDKLYDDEPSAKEEIAEVKTVHHKLSKHQEYMKNLSESGQSLAEIQTKWHEYYLQLSDSEKHEVWQPFYAKGFVSAIQDKPTTLKRKCDRKDDYFNYPIDNIYFHSERFENVESGRVDFVLDCKNLEIARGVSDHLPVYVKVKMISP